ncbi:hypothetical protein APQ14_19585 [Vibrio toranzoniae]|uniref:Uncharacterized protein n=1 Tax=Vibrio toranzoniae TaxID=1194427 RepID=A0A120DF93_9VIBR|nr:hypothetical protein [Vibrio toranzoniae]KWT98940.1 hypothetical protein APQ14_19585 [Vibrio toranzoniae]SBS38281.1 hypothetical protein VTO7225_02988 [Vibrio toranzoniae]
MFKKENNNFQVGGDNATNYQAAGDIIVNNGINQAELEKYISSLTVPQVCSDDLLINHYVCQDFSSLYEISFRDYRRFPLTNVRFLNNQVTQSLFDIIQSHSLSDRDVIIKSENYRSVEAYCEQFDNVTFPRGTSSPFKYYEVLRDIDTKELEDLSREDGLLKIMLTHNLHQKTCVAKAVGYEHGCWGIPLLEEIITRPLWGAFTAITNVSEDTIVLESIECDYLLNNGFTLLSDTREPKSIKLPPVPIPKDTTLVIPVALVLPQLGPVVSRSRSSYCGEEGERVQVLQHGSISIDYEDTYVYGDSLLINTVNYKKSSKHLIQTVQSLDFDNLLSYDMHWQIGSCPHLFINDGELKYVREVIASCQNVIGTDKYVVPIDIGELIVCELEDETTYFECIYVNGNELFSDIKLEKGEQLVVPVSKGDCVTFIGKYVPYGLPSTERSQSLTRAQVINQFLLTQNA